jgi:hypothetical protein
MTACGGGQVLQQVQGALATMISVGVIYLVLFETLSKASM